MKLAIIYNRYLCGLGGGERSTLAYGLALQRLGYEVEVVSTGGLPEAGRIEETFGREFGEIALRSVEQRDFPSWLAKANAEIFVNHTFQDFTPCPGSLGVYSQMFPTVRVQKSNRPRDVRALATYNLLLNNSSFTKRYTDLLWDFPVERSHVLHPPLGRETIDAAVRTIASPPAKEKLLMGIGRFNVYPANKNQKLMIQGFLEARERDVRLREWKLLLVGNRNPDPQSAVYHAECLELAAKGDGCVEVRSELEHRELLDCLDRAFGYVHAAGAFLPPGEEPHRCEHLGLSIAEGMAHGCVPLVYARGGIFDVLDVGVGGIPYATYEGLVAGMTEIAAMWGGRETSSVQRDLARMAQQLEFGKFAERLEVHLNAARSRQ